jgi:hypothetical protein
MTPREYERPNFNVIDLASPPRCQRLGDEAVTPSVSR